METPSNTIIKAPKTPRTSEELLCVSFSDLSFACNYSVVRTMDWRMMYEDATYETSNNTNGADTIRLLLSKKRENDTERMSLIRNILLLGSVHASEIGYIAVNPHHDKNRFQFISYIGVRYKITAYRHQLMTEQRYLVLLSAAALFFFVSRN